jgi:hypothetical protein
MKFNNKICFFLAFSFVLVVFAPQSFAQNTSDLTQVKVDELTDEQVKEIQNRAKEAGLTSEDFLKMAQQRGMPASEIAKLKIRLEQLGMASAMLSEGSTSTKRDPRQQVDINSITLGFYNPQAESFGNNVSGEIFGSSIF